MATLKQKLAVTKLLENPRLSVAGAMREAGYSPETAKVPSDLTKSDGWAELMEKYLPDNKLAKVHAEGLEATRKDAGETVADYSVRHKYLETGYKIKNKMSGDTINNVVVVPIMGGESVHLDHSDQENIPTPQED